MPCFYCGKRVSIVRQMTDADFCSDEHRTKYHDLTRMALNRLVESHEQVAAPPRRKGKGQAAAVKEPPTPVIERLEPKAPEISERPAPPVPEKRPARSHRQQSPVIVPPPPRARPDPAMAGFAGLPSAVFSLESALRFAGDDEIRLPEIEIGRFSPETPALSLRVAEPVLPASAFARPLHGVARQAPPVLFELAPALTSSGRAQAPRSEVFQDPPPASYVDLAPPAPLHGSLALNSALAPAESRRPPLSLPGGPEQSHKHDFRVGGFDYSLPAPAASRPRQTPQSASGRATVRPSAMPRLDAVQCTGLLSGGAPRALAVPRPCALKPAPSIAGITLATPPVSLPMAEKMALATGLAASEPVARRPLPVAGPLPAATLATIAAPKAAAPPLCFPELPATPASHAVPLTSALGLGMSPASQAARPAATDAPLPLPSNVLAGAIPIMLPPGTAAAATTGLPSGEAAATAVRAAAPSDKPAHAGWAAFTFDPARTLAVIGTIDATRGLVAGALHIPGTPPPKAPAHCPAWRTEATFAVPETRRPQAPAKFHQRIPDTMPAIVTTPPQFAGTAPAPLGTAAALPGREPGLPALELSIPAALSLKHQDSRPPGIAKAPVSTAAPRIVTAPIRIDAVQPPPPLPGPAHTFTLASGGILPGPDPASARNVPLRPGAVAYVEFPSESASSRAQTQPLAGACKLAGGSAIAVAGRAPAGAAHPSPPESCGLAPQDAELPGPQSIAASLALPGALCLRLSSRALAGAPSRQPAGWESMQRERGTTGFAVVGFEICHRHWGDHCGRQSSGGERAAAIGRNAPAGRSPAGRDTHSRHPPARIDRIRGLAASGIGLQVGRARDGGRPHRRQSRSGWPRCSVPSGVLPDCRYSARRGTGKPGCRPRCSCPSTATRILTITAQCVWPPAPGHVRSGW